MRQVMNNILKLLLATEVLCTSVMTYTSCSRGSIKTLKHVGPSADTCTIIEITITGCDVTSSNTSPFDLP